MRKLLILSTGVVDDALLQTISSADWEIYSAHEPGQARKHLTENTFEVGLAILLSCESSRAIQWLADLIKVRQYMRWIISLPHQCIDNPQLSEIIAERCYDFHTMPVDPARLLTTLGHAYGMVTLTETINRQQRDLESRYGLIGSSPAMQTLFRGIQKAAEVDVPVLITGESGTGKKCIAKAIHNHSARGAAPIDQMNCAALPANLIQSELFGHEKGAFPGATERHIGLIESVEGGTLFLDEIGDLAPELQGSLLRFLEEKKLWRFGGNKPIPANVRLITSTNTDLEQAVRDGRFREDLFYRINVLHLRSPALRSRKGDIPLLARHFFSKFAAETRTSAKNFSRDALEVINRYDWPGNVRELMNRIRRAVLLCEGTHITPDDLEMERRSLGRGFVTLEEARIAADREVIQATLLRTRFNIARAAQELGVSRMTLYRLMEKYDIERDSM